MTRLLDPDCHLGYPLGYYHEVLALVAPGRPVCFVSTENELGGDEEAPVEELMGTSDYPFYGIYFLPNEINGAKMVDSDPEDGSGGCRLFLRLKVCLGVM